MKAESAAAFNKWYFWVSGVVTALGAVPSMLIPTAGTQLTMGFDASEMAGVSGIFGHWGIMIVGIGILIFLCGTHKHLRATTIIFSISEKSYLVLTGLYMYSVSSDLGQHYTAAIVADSIQIIGAFYYLFVTKKIELSAQ